MWLMDCPEKSDKILLELDRLESHLRSAELPSEEKQAILKAVQEDMIDLLISAWKEGDRVVRRSAIYGLSKIGLPNCVEIFIQALEDWDEQIRVWATEGLAQIKDSRAILPLIKALGDDNHYVSFSAACSLKRFPRHEVIPPLIQSLNDRRARIRRRTCKLLGEMNIIESTENLIMALRDETRMSVWSCGSFTKITWTRPLIPD